MANIRVQLKHDLEINWKKAVNFVPKPGEMIVYEAETAAPTAEEAEILGRSYIIDYVRVKIGNEAGDTVNDLPFESLNANSVLKHGEGLDSIVHAITPE